MPFPTPLERPDLFVVVRILEGILEHPERARKTHVQQRAGVNYSLFTRYVNFLSERGLIALVPEDGGSARLALTPRGYEAYRFIVESFDRLLGSARR